MPNTSRYSWLPSNATEYRDWYAANKPEDVAWGECWCERRCGQQAPIAMRTQRAWLRFKGEPARYVPRHHTYRYRPADQDYSWLPFNAEEYERWYAEHIPDGVRWGECWCGCQQVASVAVRTVSREWAFAGLPKCRVANHKGSINTRYVERDCGYISPCWVWTSSINSTTGYGRRILNGRTLAAHRFVYELHHGPLDDGLHLHHLCEPFGGPRRCVRPEHLQPLAPAGHTRVGRTPKLDENKVRSIRSYRQAGYELQPLADMYEVSLTTIWQVVHHVTWRNV